MEIWEGSHRRNPSYRETVRYLHYIIQNIRYLLWLTLFFLQHSHNEEGKISKGFTCAQVINYPIFLDDLKSL